MNELAAIPDLYGETLHWATARDGFESVLTIFNYLGWAFPGYPPERTDADVSLRFFAEEGRELESYSAVLGTGQALHLPVGKIHRDFRGVVATRMMPRGGMARRSATPQRPGRPIATSYFMLYEREGGFCDFSHELFLMRNKPEKTVSEWATVLFSGAGLDLAVVAMNNCAAITGAEGQSDATLRLSALDGAPLSDDYRFSLSPMGSLLIRIRDVFQEFSDSGFGPVTATLSGANIEQPLSLHLHGSGDFNIHHF